MEYQYHFDVSQIIRIVFRPEYCSSYIWIEGETKIVSSWFGLIKNKIKTESGWKDEDYDHDYVRTTDELIKAGYTVYPFEKRVTARVCHKPSVVVYLTNKNEVYKKFETDQEAKLWIDNLKKVSGKTFEVA